MDEDMINPFKINMEDNRKESSELKNGYYLSSNSCGDNHEVDSEF